MSSESGQGGDKSDNNLGHSQPWIVKIDSAGNKQWDRTILNTIGSTNISDKALQTKDGCYVVYTFTLSGIGGDKTQPNWNSINGTSDFWIIKFCDTTSTIGIIEILSQNHQVDLYPNPVTNFCTIAAPAFTNSIISIYEISGRIVFTQSFNYQKNIDTESYAPGLYIVELKELNGKRGYAKLLKE